MLDNVGVIDITRFVVDVGLRSLCCQRVQVLASDRDRIRSGDVWIRRTSWYGE